MEVEHSPQIFEKYPNTKFHENPFNGSQVISWGRTDRHDGVVSLFAQILERPWEMFVFAQTAETAAGAYSALCLIGTGASFTTVQAPGHTKRTNHVPLVSGFRRRGLYCSVCLCCTNRRYTSRQIRLTAHSTTNKRNECLCIWINTQ
jgi:hypothetical protein